MNLTLYSNPMSRGRIARWMLEEVGQPYHVEWLDYRASMKSDDYLAINPMGKVPAINHDGMIVTETAAICAYLADAFPAAALAPAPTDPARGSYYRWLFFAAGPLEAAITNRALGFITPADKEAMAGYGSYDRVIEVLEAAITDRTYLAGNRFSAADVYVGSQIGFGLMFGTVPQRPAFGSYFRTLSARPAYRRAAALDDAEIAAQSATS
jgi:glutathione S-transferase